MLVHEPELIVAPIVYDGRPDPRRDGDGLIRGSAQPQTRLDFLAEFVAEKYKPPAAEGKLIVIARQRRPTDPSVQRIQKPNALRRYRPAQASAAIEPKAFAGKCKQDVIAAVAGPGRLTREQERIPVRCKAMQRKQVSVRRKGPADQRVAILSGCGCFGHLTMVGFLFETLEQQRTISPAKSERVRERRADLHLACLVRRIVQVTLRILILEIDRRRRDLITDA